MQGLQPEANRCPKVAHRDDETPRDVLSAPFSFNQLNNALESAHDEVRTLRKQYDELQALVAEKFGKGKARKGKAIENGGSGKRGTSQIATTGDELGPSCVQLTTSSLVDIVVEPQAANMENSDRHLRLKPSDSIIAEVAQLSEEEAKQALTVIAHTLNIRPSHLLTEEEVPEINATPSQIRCDLSLEEISRALDFVERIDEMVWRRTSFPMNPSLAPIFSDSNIETLRVRLELWERMVRRTGI